MNSDLQPWMLESLGKRVVLTRAVKGSGGVYPVGATGLLVSLQAGVGLDGRVSGSRHATVNFLFDDICEENIPLAALRPMALRG